MKKLIYLLIMIVALGACHNKKKDPTPIASSSAASNYGFVATRTIQGSTYNFTESNCIVTKHIYTNGTSVYDLDFVFSDNNQDTSGIVLYIHDFTGTGQYTIDNTGNDPSFGEWDKTKTLPLSTKNGGTGTIVISSYSGTNINAIVGGTYAITVWNSARSTYYNVTGTFKIKISA